MSKARIIHWFMRGLVVLTPLSILLLLSPAASAATQILGLVATAGPVELKCENGQCSAAFSSFCLQQGRKSPGFHAAYELAANQDVTLTLKGPDGAMRKIAAAGLIRVKSVRGYSAVRISVPEQAIAGLGAAGVAITVGDRVSLLPLPKVGDKSPLGLEEIAYATGPARAIAAGYYDGGEGYGGVARVLARAINTVEPHERLNAATREKRWRKVMNGILAGADKTAMARAEEQFQACQKWLNKRLVFGLRSCLEGRHDSMLRGLNIRFWKSLKPGS